MPCKHRLKTVHSSQGEFRFYCGKYNRWLPEWVCGECLFYEESEEVEENE